MRTMRCVKLFSSFPADVAEEARVLDVVADELNRTTGELSNVRVDVLNWMRDVNPGVGDDVQSVINDQIDGLYDIIVATFWARAGTPTRRAESGSIEEVKSAVLRSKKGVLPFVLVYFRVGGLDIFRVDMEQVKTLLQFRDWLSEHGVLFKEFSDRESFETLLRIDLSKTIASLASLNAAEFIQKSHDQLEGQPTGEADEDDDLGLLDYLDIQSESFSLMTDVVRKEAESLEIVNSAISSITNDLKAFNREGGSRSEFRRLLKKSADVWMEFSASSESRFSLFKESSDRGFDAISKGLSLAGPRDDVAKDRLVLELKSYMDSAKIAADSTRSYRGMVTSTPRMTAENNRAKRHLAQVLDRWVSQFERNANLAQEILLSIKSTQPFSA